MDETEPPRIERNKISQEYEEAISEKRYQVAQYGFWWRIKVGDGDSLYGKFYSKDSALEMAALLRREFLNGSFVARKRIRDIGELGQLIVEGSRQSYPIPHA